MNDLHCLVYATLLTAIMMLFASLVRAKAWTLPGTVTALGNRDDLPDATLFSGRADRAGKNMLEGMVMFIAVLFAGHATNVDAQTLSQGATLFLGARIVYWPLYLLGVKYVRTAVWLASMFGIAMIGQAALAG